MVSSLLLGPNYYLEPPTLDDIKIASIVWGATLGVALLTGWKAAEQSLFVFRRKKWSWYILMVWSLWIACVVQGTVCWVLMMGEIAIGFPIFFVQIMVWAVQSQLILQVILNRSALVIADQRKAVRLRWTVFGIVGLINISVFCIWIPARLQTNKTFIKINNVWDRVEKVIFLFVDAGLNAYFLYLVKARLLRYGLEKYRTLFKFNACIVVVSLSLDVIIIGTMSLKNDFSYSQFHGLAYLIKLHIELVMTDLIVKVVRGSHTPAYSALNLSTVTIGGSRQHSAGDTEVGPKDTSKPAPVRSKSAPLQNKTAPPLLRKLTPFVSPKKNKDTPSTLPNIPERTADSKRQPGGSANTVPELNSVAVADFGKPKVDADGDEMGVSAPSAVQRRDTMAFLSSMSMGKFKS